VKQNHTSIKNWPIDDRPRERFKRLGAGVLTDSELLAILLGTGNSKDRQSALDIARSLLNKFGDLKGLSATKLTQITEISGIGEVKAIKILATFEIAKRLLQNGVEKLVKFQSRGQVFETYRQRLGTLEHEVFIMLTLNAKNQVIAEERLAKGNISAVLINPRDVFATALSQKAVSVLFLHNHPSGNLQPSCEDLALTSRLKKAGDVLGVRVLDHLIITTEGYKSLISEIN
jgi:DNA repair protein RadC